MPFGMVSDGVGRWMGILDGGGDRRRESGSFGAKCGASHCNQWDSLREGRVCGFSQITLGFLIDIVVATLPWTNSSQLSGFLRHPVA